MGWASYLEDIQDRLSNDHHHLRAVLDRPSSHSAELQGHARALLVACEGVLLSIREHLELATDPEFDLSFEIAELDREKAALERQVVELSARRSELDGQIKDMQSGLKELKIELKHQRQLSKLKDDDLEKRLRANPDAAYELYGPPESD